MTLVYKAFPELKPQAQPHFDLTGPPAHALSDSLRWLMRMCGLIVDCNCVTSPTVALWVRRARV